MAKIIAPLIFGLMGLIAVACSSEEPESRTKNLAPSIQIVNYSRHSTDDIENWVAFAESKMQSRGSRIFVLIYPVGAQIEPEKRIRSDYADQVFREHEVLLSGDQIESILGEIETWFRGDHCSTDNRKSLGLSDYRTWLEKGADASTMHGLCETTRVVMMAITQQMRDHETIEDFYYFLSHELYHAFQQDLEDEGECRHKRNQAGRNSNSVWMYEGAAHYFGTWLVAEEYGKTNYRSEILESAKLAFERQGNSQRLGWDTEPDKLGAAALSLMIEHDMVTEESILDGSLFHECARELEFDHNSLEIQHIKNSWHLIKNDGEVFHFKKEAYRDRR